MGGNENMIYGSIMSHQKTQYKLWILKTMEIVL